MDSHVHVRDITADDIPAVAAVQYNPGLHRDRVIEAATGSLRYLLAELDGEVVGFGMLIWSNPQGWPPVGPVPQMVDLFVRDDIRGKGIGTTLIREMEAIARDRGVRTLYIGVEPEANPKAYALYQRLGYEPISTEIRAEETDYTDSDGVRHQYVEYVIDLKKDL